MAAARLRESLIDILERIANWFVGARTRRHRLRRQRRIEHHTPRTWPLVYPPPPEHPEEPAADTSPPQTPR